MIDEGKLGYFPLRLLLSAALRPNVAWVRGLLNAARATSERRCGRPMLGSLCAAHQALMRAGPSRPLTVWLRSRIERAIPQACEREFPERCVTAVSETAHLLAARGAGLVLKAPVEYNGRVVERGVLVLKYNRRIDSFRRSIRLAAVLEHYALVLEPSWSGYANQSLLVFTSHHPQTIMVMTNCLADYEFLERLGSNLRPLWMGASDWVDPRVFRPVEGTTKQFDAVMIARWAVAKRHWVLLRALRVINRPDFRVALAATNTSMDLHREAILAMIRRSGLSGQISIFEDLSPPDLNDLLNRSKVNLLLSRQEGSNRSLFEGFFAGVPGLALANHLSIPKSYFISKTGRLIDEHELAATLLEFRETWRRFDPRPWALANIAPELTTGKLNMALRELASERGEPWTRDIVAKCNRPGLRYYPNDLAGSGLESMNELVERFGQKPPSVVARR